MNVRFGVSFDPELLKKFDKLIKEKGYPNRSEALRDLVRKALVEEEWKKGKEVVGVLVIVFSHEKRGLSSRLLDQEHHHYREILSTLHIHLDRENCLEATVLRGRPEKVKEIAEKIIATKGVKYGVLVPATYGKEIK
ncbi:nickel-responsive transcriptional regulator NikR [bacterium]|nr:MAG: nickel-responsive transcriptional regulator NikR [bacterium]